MDGQGARRNFSSFKSITISKSNLICRLKAFDCQDGSIWCHLDGGRPLAVVEYRQLPECLAHAESAEHLAVLDHLVLTLGRDVEVIAKLP